MRLLRIAVLLLMPAGPTFAQQVVTIPFIDAPAGTPALGGGVANFTSPYAADNTRSDLIPLYLYQGKRFFSYGTEIGMHAWSNDRFFFDVLGRYRFDRLEQTEGALEGVQQRDQTVDGGIRLGLQGGWGELDATWVTDLRNKHNGTQLDLNYSRRFDIGRWSLTPWISFMQQDGNLVDYYFGVSEPESGPELPVYRPGAATNLGYGLNSTFYVDERLLLFGNLGFYGFDDKITMSPLVVEDGVAVGYFGGAYLFGEVSDSRFVPLQRRSEWSWRINAGYQAQANIVGGVSTGDFERSRDADTQIAGFTVSKLLMGGNKVDFYGRLAAFRHFENDLQDDFWSGAAYVMAVGKGYVPWTDDVAFRYGFGMGASYAEKVPSVEKIKQARKNGNTSHFLNYLELMVDFSIDRIAPGMQGCFAGLSVVHRSGIFSTSDLLGNVGGGSDWLTLHLECLR